MPRWRIRPCSRSSASAPNGSAIARSGRPTADPQVDDVERVQAEVLEVLVDGLRELLGLQRGLPAALGAAPRADLGDDVQVVRVRVQRLLDELVDDVRPVEVAGVDVGDAQLDGLAQDRDGRVRSLGGPKTPGPASCMAP